LCDLSGFCVCFGFLGKVFYLSISNLTNTDMVQMTQTYSEELLIKGLKQKSEAHFSYLIKNYENAIGLVVSKFNINGQDKEDLMQEIWIKVFNKISTFESDKGGIYAWIKKMTSNLCIDWLRKNKKVSVLDLEGYENVLRDQTFNSEKQTHSVLLKELFNKDLENRPSTKSVKLYYFEDLTVKEISKELKMPIGTVKSQIRLATMRFRQTVA
jgi:RNA polymerase sigma factor (sigma-70 family)